jgi:Tfp pilus assembly protein PilO
MHTLRDQIRWCARFQWCLAGVMLLVVGAFIVLGYVPKTSRMRELQSRIRDQQRDLMAASLRTRILPEVAAEVERLKVKLERTRKSIPPQQELPQFIRDVTQLSQQATLKKFGYKPGVPSRGELVCELPIQFSFEGDFVNVFSFLRNTEEMPRLTRVRGMSVKTRDRDRNGQVKVELSMNIYFAAE